MKPKNPIKKQRLKVAQRERRVRARIHGSAEKPRLSVRRTLKHFYAQVIDDVNGRTLAAASDADVVTKAKPVEIAREVGRVLATRAKEKGVSAVAFDRGSHRYHGRVAAFADGAREVGLNF